MTDLTQTMAAYVPPNIVRATLCNAHPAPPDAARAENIPAAVLLADISGFTPLTETLARKGREGPEELTRLLNTYFSRMIALIEAEGGEVVKFSGDALTVVFPAEPDQGDLGLATRRAMQAATAMQLAMVDFSTLPTSVGTVALGMKIGVGAGTVIGLWVGGANGRWEYVIAGDPLRQVAQAEHQAERGQIIISPEAECLLAPDPVAPRPLAQPDWGAVENTAAVQTALRAYVPSGVIKWLAGDLQNWLAVLRPMSVLFVGVAGIDYTTPAAVDTLHTFFRAAQETIFRYEGRINKLAVDDKGTVLIALLGVPPFAHENDPERAVRSAFALQALAQKQGLQLAIGVTTGRVFTGPVGSVTRREYTVMGDTVNLAARLMGVAGPGQIRCDYETYRAAQAKLAFDTLLPVRVKGKASQIRLYCPVGEKGKNGHPGADTALVGRKAEIARFKGCLDHVQAGQSRILLVEGEAGIGKSRLVEALFQLMRERGIAGLLGQGLSVEQKTPYRAWRDIFTSYFELDDIDDRLERRKRVVEQVTDTAPHLLERLPLLNDLLGLGLPENTLTASLDTQLRNESLVSLLLTLLRTWAEERPLVLVLEDAHWLDSLSWDLALQTARALAVVRAPLLLVVVMRPIEGETAPGEAIALAAMPQTEHLYLSTLSPEETITLAAARLGVTHLPPVVAELVRTRTGGNPFFAEELIYTLRDNGLIAVENRQGQNYCLIKGDLASVAQTLPDTIQGIVLSRIDRLPPEEQLALKVAAVIGRTFAFSTLQDTLSEHVSLTERLLKIFLDDLSRLDLTPLEAPEPELTYIFKHIITQEVAYETLLFAQRRILHKSVALWFERVIRKRAEHPADGISDPSPAPYYPLLVYHWHHAQDEDRERHYAALAGQWAAAQFANMEALVYLSRALKLTPAADWAAVYALLLVRESVYDLLGRREEQAEDIARLADLSQKLADNHRQAAIALRQAAYFEAVSNYPQALAAAQQAVDRAEQAQDIAATIEGYTISGKLLWRQGKYAAAQAELERTLPPAQAGGLRLAEAKILYHLGHVHLYQENYPPAQSYYQRALEIYHAEGNRQGETDSLSNLGVIHYELGDYPPARDLYERALTIFRTIGDRRGETMMLNNLGTVYGDLGDYETARDYHEQALAIYRTIGDRGGEAASLVNLGLIYHCLAGNAAARAHCEQALAIQQEIGDERGQGYSFTYLGHALADLGALDEAARAYQQAATIRERLGQHSLVMDDLAGLAEVALAQGNLSVALDHVHTLLGWLETNGPGGIEYPLRIYLTCYRVLSAAKRPGAEIIRQAHRLLLERADSISKEPLRRKFLENVAAHREIMALAKT